jgi:hypothetical protein
LESGAVPPLYAARLEIASGELRTPRSLGCRKPGKAANSGVRVVSQETCQGA